VDEAMKAKTHTGRALERVRPVDGEFTLAITDGERIVSLNSGTSKMIYLFRVSDIQKETKHE